MRRGARMSRGDRYSRTVAWLKIVLPLIALALLSTLFLLSRAMQPEAVIPFAEKEVQDRLRDQQITRPFFSGKTADGDELSFSADTLKSPEGPAGSNLAENIRARIVTAAGATFQLRADDATLDVAGDAAVLEGDVTITTSSGYRVNTARLTSGISSIEIVAPQRVEALGPIGTLTAGSMTIAPGAEGAGTQMLFRDGVKLVYMPN